MSMPTGKPLRIGTKTKFGEIVAFTFDSGERWYICQNEHGTLSRMPADVVEAMTVPKPASDHED